jgi:hypothetical protein
MTSTISPIPSQGILMMPTQGLVSRDFYRSKVHPKYPLPWPGKA